VGWCLGPPPSHWGGGGRGFVFPLVFCGGLVWGGFGWGCPPTPSGLVAFGVGLVLVTDTHWGGGGVGGGGPPPWVLVGGFVDPSGGAYPPGNPGSYSKVFCFFLPISWVGVGGSRGGGGGWWVGGVRGLALWGWCWGVCVLVFGGVGGVFLWVPFPPGGGHHTTFQVLPPPPHGKFHNFGTPFGGFLGCCWGDKCFFGFGLGCFFWGCGGAGG